jgi:N-acetyl-anhydromuramyl-L-alanine amidase AmpD
MILRRDFLRGLVATALASFGGGGVAAAQKRKASPEGAIRFTGAVREVTRSLRVQRGRWKYFICHHSGLKHGNAAVYEREHRRRGMENGLAYHFVIGNGVDSEDGLIEIGQRWIKQIKGGHVKSDEMNEVAIGICLVGNFDETRPTKKQVAALCELVEYLRSDVVGPGIRLLSHSEAHPGHTECPGKYFPMKRLHQLYG